MISGRGKKVNIKELGRMVGKEKTQQQKLALDHSFIQLVVTDNLLSGSPEPCILKSGRANTFPPK